MTNFFRWIPSVEAVLNNENIEAVNGVDRRRKAEIAAEEADFWRNKIKTDTQGFAAEFADEAAFRRRFVLDLQKKLTSAAGGNLKKVINGTGIVLHTNLGRAPLAKAAVAAVNGVIGGYCNLELDLNTGERSATRFANVHNLICKITGAEDCIVVNNNAAAVLLALNTFACSKEGVISRGQLVEIGGSFRVPEIMEKSGVRLHEIGTTNKTHISDYAKAINEETGVLLVIHPSNFHMSGFVETPELAEVAALGREHGITTVYDWGCGALYPLAGAGIGSEANIKKLVKSGVDIITMSGDKLLGGPQCGIIVGSKEKISEMYENPLTRALRPDKMILAALEGTLRCYTSCEKAKSEIPAINFLTADLRELEIKAKKLAKMLEEARDDWEISLEYTKGLVGGGSLPEVKLPTCVVKIAAAANLQSLAKEMRLAKTPVIGYIRGNTFNLDVRTLRDEDLPLIKEAAVNLDLNNPNLNNSDINNLDNNNLEETSCRE